MKPRTIIILRGLISLSLLVVFIILAVTGLLMYLGTGKGELLHTIAALVMSVLVVIHLMMSYKMLIAEIKAIFARGEKS